MKCSIAVSSVLTSLIAGCGAFAHNEAPRALPNSPQGYTPSFIDCPSTPPSIRIASDLSSNETEWVQKRRPVAISYMRDFLTRMNITNFNAASYIDRYASTNISALPNVGIAISGGGWRALMNGAGALEAFDIRAPNSTAKGHLGGLLQSSTYVAGLSGGSWLLTSLYTNNFTSVTASEANNVTSLWQFGSSLTHGPASIGLIDYWENIVSDLKGKADAGFDLTITDLWGRALSYQLINATDGGPSYTFSSIALTQGFQDATQPFPLVVADARLPGQQILSVNSTVYEFNPFEMGSWDADVYGFMPTRYLGTNMTAGNVTSGDQCVVGFDNCGYVLGTSSSLFNEFLLNSNNTQTTLPTIVKNLIIDLLEDASQDDLDIAAYSPNPFYGWNNMTNPYAQAEQLTLVDGGEDLQATPYYPLIQPIRNVDVIFAIDSAYDTPTNWPNGTSIIATYERSLAPNANGTGFPYIPDANTMINLGLNNHPTFFGCNSSNVTHTGQGHVPLIVYLPNAPYNAYSNLSTFQMTTNDTQRDVVIQNGYNIATMANATIDSTWPMCVACAMLSRSFERTNTTVPDACATCFKKFCWNGTLNSTTPPLYNPTPLLKLSALSGGDRLTRSGMAMGLVWMVILSMVIVS